MASSMRIFKSLYFAQRISERAAQRSVEQEQGKFASDIASNELMKGRKQLNMLYNATLIELNKFFLGPSHGNAKTR